MPPVKKTSLIFSVSIAALTGWLLMAGFFQAAGQLWIAAGGPELAYKSPAAAKLAEPLKSWSETITGLFFRSDELDFDYLTNQAAAVIISQTDKSALEQAATDDNRLIFVGDIMLDRGVAESVVNNLGGDFNALFSDLNLSGADILFGNLEGPVSDRGRDRGHLYPFRMVPAALSALAAAGFDVLSVANNHVGDFGREAFLDTLDRLKAAGILHPGGGRDYSEARRPQIITKNSVRFGFLAFSDVGPDSLAASENESGILLANDHDFPEIISSAAGEVDVLVVSFHFGDEYELRANARQKNLAKQAIDLGAKLIIGHHPHVVQAVDKYKDGLIVYSLGNFIFDQNFSEATMRGLILEVVMSGDEIKTWQTKTVILDDQFVPRPAEEIFPVG